MPYNTFSILAPAKVNLFLHITGRREDGYHLLQSLMVFLDVGDNLEFAPYDTLFIDVDGPFAGELGPVHENLVYRAAQALGHAVGIKPHGKILLTKNLPLASGIGGGSSDAAATMIGLSKLWGLSEDPGRLQKLGEKLGADVPACLVRRPVWAEGIGEKMTPLPEMPPLHFVLINPLKETPTPEVFNRYRPRYSQPIQFMGRRKSTPEWIADLKRYRNDLTHAAEGVTPEIKDALHSLEDTPSCSIARLSGSGATCFGIYETQGAAQAAVNKLRQKHPDWWIAPAGLMK